MLKQYNQIKFTMSLGSGENGKDRMRRYQNVAKLVVGKKQRGAMLEWIRRVCDEAAYKVLNGQPR